MSEIVRDFKNLSQAETQVRQREGFAQSTGVACQNNYHSFCDETGCPALT
jgi:hypothetical protein